MNIDKDITDEVVNAFTKIWQNILDYVRKEIGDCIPRTNEITKHHIYYNDDLNLYGYCENLRFYSIKCINFNIYMTEDYKFSHILGLGMFTKINNMPDFMLYLKNTHKISEYEISANKIMKLIYDRGLCTLPNQDSYNFQSIVMSFTSKVFLNGTNSFDIGLSENYLYLLQHRYYSFNPHCKYEVPGQDEYTDELGKEIADNICNGIIAITALQYSDELWGFNCRYSKIFDVAGLLEDSGVTGLHTENHGGYLTFEGELEGCKAIIGGNNACLSINIKGKTCHSSVYRNISTHRSNLVKMYARKLIEEWRRLNNG